MSVLLRKSLVSPEASQVVLRGLPGLKLVVAGARHVGGRVPECIV